jgi:hypothetical protein
MHEEVKSFVAYSIAADESTDINNTTQLAIFIHDAEQNSDVTKRLLGRVPMIGITSGNDLFLCVTKMFTLDYSKLINVELTKYRQWFCNGQYSASLIQSSNMFLCYRTGS